MACFTVPLAEALVVTAVKHGVFRASKEEPSRWGVVRAQLGTLQRLLFGGSFLLAVEHVYHGEVVLYPPFLTAMQTPEEIPAMLHEMATVGTGMALLVTAAWGIVWGAQTVVSALRRRRGAVPGVQGAV